MNARKILYPTDFSSAGHTALEMATSLARDRGATLLIAHVEEPPMVYGGVEFYYGIEGVREEIARRLKEVVPAGSNIAFEHRLIAGLPAPAIVELAEQENVELIVMSTHGRTGLTRVLMGSVAEEVVRKAKCPVLTVKPSAAAIARHADAACEAPA